MIERLIDSWTWESDGTACYKASAMLVPMKELIPFEIIHDELVDFISERDLQWRYWWVRTWWERHTISWYKRVHPRRWRSLLLKHPRIFRGGSDWLGHWLPWHPQSCMLSGCRWDRLFIWCCYWGISAMLCWRVWFMLLWRCVGAKDVSQFFNSSCRFGAISPKGCCRARIVNNSDEIMDSIRGVILWG